MIGRFVEDKQVWLKYEYVSKCNTLLLATRQLSYGLLQIAYLELSQYLLGLQYFFRISLMVKTSVEHRLLRVKLRRLL
jgi:hypothetical protein